MTQPQPTGRLRTAPRVIATLRCFPFLMLLALAGCRESTVVPYSEFKTLVRAGDVAGVDEAKDELEEIVKFLREPAKFSALGARTPKGVLLVGPPGTGKTMLARAVAGEANVPFYPISGSDFVEVFVGVGAQRVRKLFAQAKAKAPSILFTDTLDAALLRPGRFDRQVLVDRPDGGGREAILKVHAKKLTLAGDADLAKIARRTSGMAGADLENVLNEAALLAARNDKLAVGMF